MKTLCLSIPVLFVLSLLAPGKSHAQIISGTGGPHEMLAKATDLFLPNAFSPNGDGLNDRFVPLLHNPKRYDIYSFRIFNRSGQEVYNVQGKSSGWDGTYHGQPAASGTYFYCLEVFGDDGRQKMLKGNVVLIR